MSICGKKTSAAYNQLDLMKYRIKQKRKGAENVYLKAAGILNPVEDLRFYEFFEKTLTKAYIIRYH